MESDLDKAFKKSFDKISNLNEAIPPDAMLKLYAFYKQANYGNNFLLNNSNLNGRNAFKFNAWIQLYGMSIENAKREYIKLANTITKS